MPRILRFLSYSAGLLSVVILLLLCSPGQALADGEIPFGTTLTITDTADSAYAVLAVDLDSDGDQDVISASMSDNRIAWYENSGDSEPSFSSHTITNLADGATSVYAADLDQDGDLDVLSSSWTGNTIKWYKNMGGAPTTFVSRTITNTAINASAVYAADVDGDGDTDVLSASMGDNKIAWYENNGASEPTFASHIVTNSAQSASSVYATDLDGDGDADIVAAAWNGDEIAWYENDGNRPPDFTYHTITSSALLATSVYAADIDGDGDQDILSASEGNDTIAWYENDGALPPTFATHIVTDMADGAMSVYATDLEGDGDIDVLSAAWNNHQIAWYENDGAPQPTFFSHVIDADAQNAHSVYAADLDGDGDVDTLSAIAGHNKIAWYENLSIHQSATYPIEEPIETNGEGIQEVCLQDIDRDGDQDILVALDTGDIAWWRNEGGNVLSWTEISVDPQFAGARVVHAGDMDGDGSLDALGAAYDTGGVAWWRNQDGSGTSWSRVWLDQTFAGATAIYASDVDGDGDLDAIGAAAQADSVAWWRNEIGDGSSWTKTVIDGTFDGAIDVRAADLDQDGAQDVVGAAFEAGDVVWWRNQDGTGSSWNRIVIDDNLEGATALEIADLDGDGDLDVLGAATGAEAVVWWRNEDGRGTLWARMAVSSSFAGVADIRSADVDEDGDWDIVGTAPDAGATVWWENTDGAASNWALHDVSQTVGGQTVGVVDLDGDGALDIVGATVSTGHLVWWKNRGGQFALATQGTAPATIVPGQTDDMLRITATHRGRTGDSGVEIASFSLLFEEGEGDPLTSNEANNLIENLSIYQDDGSGSFEQQSDMQVLTVTALSLVSGTQTVAFVDNAPEAQVSHGTPVTYFVVAELKANAGGQTPRQFRMTHLTESGSQGEDGDHDLPLRLEFFPDAASGICIANTPPTATASITPQEPQDGDNLTLIYDFNDQDPEDNLPSGETLIRWTRNGRFQPAYNGQQEVAALATIPGDRWCVTITPHDGIEYGPQVQDCVQVVYRPNRPPEAHEVILTPAMPTSWDSLISDYVFYDPDGDGENEADRQRRWYRNGQLQPAFNDAVSIPSSHTYPGDTWYVRIRLHDGIQYGSFAQSNSVLIAPTNNAPPQALAPRIAPVAPNSGDALELEFDYYDPDGEPNGDPGNSTEYRWYRNGMLQPFYNDARIVPAWQTRPGDKWVVTIHPHDGQDYGLLVETEPVLITEAMQNTPPQVQDVSIAPALPYASNHLRLEYVYLDADSDLEGDTTIRWYKVGDDRIVHQVEFDGLTSIPASHTASGDIWVAKVIPHDGTDYGPPAWAHSVTVAQDPENRVPIAYSVLIYPASPGATDNLQLHYATYDADGDPEGMTQIRWTLDGNTQGGFDDQTIVPAGATEINQRWCATVIPHDGIEYGEAVESNCIRVGASGNNARPEAKDIHITPWRPTSDEDLELYYTYFDSDNQPEGDTQIRWYQNGVLQADFNDLTCVPESETAPGQEWSVEVTPHDGLDAGPPTHSLAIMINHPPEIRNLEIRPAEPESHEILVLYYEYHDPDQDPANELQVRWYRNDQHQAAYDDKFFLPTHATTPGDRWQATMTAHDGFEYGPTSTSQVVTIGPYLSVLHGLYLPLAQRNYQAGFPWDEFCEPNDTQDRAYPLDFAEEVTAYADDLDDWYYVFLDETAALRVSVSPYLADGQVVVYAPDPENDPPRRVLAHAWSYLPSMQIPNEMDPFALRNLPPGLYYIRVYTVRTDTTNPYSLITHRSMGFYGPK